MLPSAGTNAFLYDSLRKVGWGQVKRSRKKSNISTFVIVIMIPNFVAIKQNLAAIFIKKLVAIITHKHVVTMQ